MLKKLPQSIFNLSSFDAKLTKVSNILLKASIALAIILVVGIVVSSIFNTSYVIKPIEVPSVLETGGVSGEFFANAISDKITEIVKESQGNIEDTNERKTKQPLNSDAEMRSQKVILDENTEKHRNSILQMEIGGLGINFNSIIESARHLLGIPQNTVSGDIIIIDQTLSLRLKITGHKTLVISRSITNKSNIKENCDSLIFASAEYIVQKLNPLDFIYYGYKIKKDSVTSRVAYEIIRSNNEEEKHALNILGLLAKRREDFGFAISIFGECIKQDDSFGPAYNNLAICYTGLGNFDSAVSNYQKAINLAPNYAPYRRNLGICYAYQREYLKSIDNLRIAISLDTLNPDYLRSLATVYRKMKKYDDAINLYNLCLRIDNDYARTYNNIAVVYQYKKDFENSFKYANISLNVNKNYAYAYSTKAENCALLNDSKNYRKNIVLALKNNYKLTSLRKNDIHMHYLNEIKFDSVLNIVKPNLN